MWVPSLGREDPLKKGMETHSNIVTWRIPWTEESDGLQFIGSQRVGQNLVCTSHCIILLSQHRLIDHKSVGYIWAFCSLSLIYVYISCQYHTVLMTSFAV